MKFSPQIGDVGWLRAKSNLLQKWQARQGISIQQPTGVLYNALELKAG